MKLHIYLLQIVFAFLMIIVFPIYVATSAEVPGERLNHNERIEFSVIQPGHE